MTLHKLCPIMVFILICFVSGCATREINEGNVDVLLHNFQEGTLQLSSSLETSGNNGRFSSQYVELANKRKWTQFSKLVIMANSADDLSWYLLGISAEGLGYKKAARQYYVNSVNSPVKLCHAGNGYLKTVCCDLYLPEESLKQLRDLH